MATQDLVDSATALANDAAGLAQKAKLLGFPTYAHWKLSDSMAKDPKAAMELMH